MSSPKGGRRPPPPPAPHPSMLSSFPSLMALQLLSRGFTFLLNQALFRLASPRAFGAASIQLELVLSTIVFLAREGVRGGVLRGGGGGGGSAGGGASSRAGTKGLAGEKEDKVQEAKEDDDKQKEEEQDRKTKLLNLSFLPLLLGIPLALLTSLVYARWLAGAEVRAQPGFRGAVALYAGAGVLELLSEPLYNVAMGELKTSIRIRAEGLGITAKSVTTFLVLLYDSRRGSVPGSGSSGSGSSGSAGDHNARDHNAGDLALWAFALGQVAYSAVMFAVYVRSLGWGYMRVRRPPSPTKGKGKGGKATWTDYIDKDTLHLSFTMTSQSLVKHFLTEGDKVILSWFSPLQDQGGYALAVNYGSLVARIVFQPIEESLRLFFSRTLGNTANKSSSADHSSALTKASTTLRALLSIQSSLSLIFITFASAYLPILLPALLPAQYLATSAPRVLAAWVWYIPVLAVNGALEAFLASVAGPGEVNAQSRWMVGFSGIYIGSAILLYRAGFGDASLVYANIVNLTARIIYALRFVSAYFNSQQTKTKFQWQNALIPSPSLILASAVSALLIWVSGRRSKADEVAAQLGRRALLNPAVLLHVGVGGILGVACLGVWWTKEGRRMRRRKAD